MAPKIDFLLHYLVVDLQITWWLVQNAVFRKMGIPNCVCCRQVVDRNGPVSSQDATVEYGGRRIREPIKDDNIGHVFKRIDYGRIYAIGFPLR